MLEWQAHDGFAAWCDDGRSFRIFDPQRFAEQCLPQFFKHNKLGSFHQQLLTYGFHRVPNRSCLDISSVWQHASFRRGEPAQLDRISRGTLQRAGTKRGAEGEGNGRDFEEDEIDETEMSRMQAEITARSLSRFDLEIRDVGLEIWDLEVSRFEI